MYGFITVPGTYLRAKWKLRAFYNDTVKPPKYPGMFAIEVVTVDDFSKQMELDIFNKRDDIEVEVIQVGP